MCVKDERRILRGLRYDQVCAMRRPTAGMALFGMVWLLRVRSEMKRCAKCRRQEVLHAEERASASTFFTIDAPSAMPSTGTASPGPLAPTTYCEVHGYNLPKEDIQEFYELTLLDETKSVQEKTAETIRIANKWETSDGPIASYTNNDSQFGVSLGNCHVMEIAAKGMFPTNLEAANNKD
ncbi:hypothetical protein TcasGA2_TC000850 [Tribolium castaneum]|uniref:Uncharacterized protein n=1 Tax=Tribolium castaneum TaxID=7070 RepID=D6W8Q4_TRICA|nr:hypothetical protein TcasGA2_TC000850 [Tribolium castaneum]